jgi:hypothetical protein
MKIYQYKCTLLSDIIITSEAATEGYAPSLDYIPGSKFLGIVAGKLYDEDTTGKTLDLFHNGTVQYGDATLFYKNNHYLKPPFSWFTEKGESIHEKVYVHHLLESKDKQLKQVRSGYFSPESKGFVSIDQDYSLKSAQDAKTRRSKDGQMFGYHSLRAGTEWTFEIRDAKGVYAEELKGIIEGIHRIGRSRTAEYGLVEITFMKEVSDNKEEVYSDELVVYAKSNLCFVDEHSGAYTAIPSAKQLCGADGAKILWNKSQVRSRNYKTWNRKRWNKDADRLIIERGSVFVIELDKEVESIFYKNGIGNHKSEGFGQVLLNPDFLQSAKETLAFKIIKEELNPYQKSVVATAGMDDKIYSALKGIYKREDFVGQIDKLVNNFKSEHQHTFQGISKSQWGALRNYGKHLSKREDFITMIFDKESGFLYRGQSENEWRNRNRRTVLEESLKKLSDEQFFPFVIKLSNQMSKNN